MNEHNKHHHRKTKGNKTGTAGEGYNSGGSKQPAPGPTANQSATDAEVDRATGLKKDPADLNFGDATLQTPEEHAIDKSTDITQTDTTSSTP